MMANQAQSAAILLRAAYAAGHLTAGSAAQRARIAGTGSALELLARLTGTHASQWPCRILSPTGIRFAKASSVNAWLLTGWITVCPEWAPW